MSQEDLSHYIPSHLDAPPKFLFWELDIAAVFGVFLFVGIAVEWPITGTVVGVLAAYWYKKGRAGRHPGMAAHLLYWYTGTPQPKDLPGGHIRELNG